MITFENFMEKTTANFSVISKDEFETLGFDYYNADHYSFFSGSTYWYKGNKVYRLSNHWGEGIASCNWFLDGNSYGMLKSDEKIDRIGVCDLSDFLLLKSGLFAKGANLNGVFFIDEKLHIGEINIVERKSEKISETYTKTTIITNLGILNDIVGLLC